MGGGGGWGCDGSQQGFVAGIIYKDSDTGKTSIETHAELVDHSTCCYHKMSAELQSNGTAQDWHTENDQKIYRSEEWIEDQLSEHFDKTCGGLECKERRELLEDWRAKERLQGQDGEAKRILDEERERESGGVFEFSDYFKQTIAEVRSTVESRKAATSSSKYTVE